MKFLALYHLRTLNHDCVDQVNGLFWIDFIVFPRFCKFLQEVVDDISCSSDCCLIFFSNTEKILNYY